VPDEQNFAMTPFLAPLSDVSPQTGMPRDTNGATRATEFARFLPETNSLPRGILWPPGEAHDLRMWAAAFQQETNSRTARGGYRRYPRSGRYGSITPFRPIPPTAAPSNSVQFPGSEKEAALIVLDKLQRCEPVLAELQAAKRRPHCRFALAYDKPYYGGYNGYQIALFGVCRVLALHASAATVAGRSDNTFEDADLALYICQALKEELPGNAFPAVPLNILAHGLAAHNWSEFQLSALQTRLEATALLPGFVQWLYRDRDLVLNPLFDHWGGIMTLEQMKPDDEDVTLDLLLRTLWVLIPHQWIRFEQLNYNRLFRDTLLPGIDLARGEIRPAATRQLHAIFMARTNGWLVPLFRHTFFAGLMFYNDEALIQKVAFAQNNVTMAATACALERYRLAQGEYPAALNDLVPRFMARLPHDIINGQPLKYRRATNGRFVLYSVGWNEKDDGGIVGVSHYVTGDRYPDINEGDWVWEQPR
jgi:hypothetical protein